MKLKHSLFLVPLLLISGACKIKQQALDTGIKVPASYTNASDSILIDSLKYDEKNAPETWTTFFTDDKLKNLISVAFQNNFDAKTAYQNIQLAKGQMALTNGVRLPDLGIGVGAGMKKYGEYTESGVGNYDVQFSTNITPEQVVPLNLPDFDIYLTTNWEIDIWGKLNNKRKANFFHFLATEEARKVIFTTIISEVARGYFNLMLLDHQVDIYTQNLELQEKALETVQFQKEGGKVTELAVELINAQYLNAKSYLLELRQLIIEEEIRLNILLGRYPQAIERNKLTTNDEITKAVNFSIPSHMLQNRPDIRSAEQRLRAENANVKAAKAAFYPQLTINARIGLNAFRADYWFNPSSLAYNVVGGLFAPLLNRRALRSELINSKANQSLAYINYEKTIVTAFGEVFELTSKMELIEQQVQIKKEQVEILRNSIETSQALFTSGRAGYLEIITAQENYLRAQKELQETQRLKSVIAIQLFKAIGGGTR